MKFIINFFKNLKERKNQKEIAENEKVIRIKKDIKTIEAKAKSVYDSSRKQDREFEQQHNSNCPKCKSKNVGDRFLKREGSIDGSSSSYNWSALTFGEGASTSSLRGELKTKEVNKCNDCQHEWDKYKMYRVTYEYEYIRNYVSSVMSLLTAKYQSENCEFDPKDLSEEYDSLSEKRHAYQMASMDDEKIKSVKCVWLDIHIDSFYTIAKMQLRSIVDHEKMNLYRNDEYMQLIGFKK